MTTLQGGNAYPLLTPPPEGDQAALAVHLSLKAQH